MVKYKLTQLAVKILPSIVYKGAVDKTFTLNNECLKIDFFYVEMISFQFLREKRPLKTQLSIFLLWVDLVESPSYFKGIK